MKSYSVAAVAAILFSAAAAQAAAISTTWSVANATASINASTGAITASGPCTLTNIGNCTFTATVNLAGGLSATAPFTITVSGGTITGNISGTLLSSAATGGTGSGSATITGGTGTYAGSTGSFPNMTGTGSISGSGLVVSFSGAGTINTNGGGTSTPVPTISGVLDAGSYTTDIAQGSVFVVKGTNLSPSGYTPLAYPLPTSSGGVSISFAPVFPNSGAATAAYLVYLYNLSGVNQLAAVLPSTLATGNYNVTVTAGGQTSTPAVVQVVARKPSLITGDSTGNGLALIQNYISASQLDIDRFTVGTVGGFTISPAHPGQVEIAYSVGMGASPGADNVASPGYNFLANGVTVNAIVGGVTIPAAYAGRVAGGSGYEQINFTLPANVPTGCTVPFQISVNGTLSNSTFLSIAPTGATACVQPGFTTADLQAFDSGSKVVYTGGFSLTQISATVPGVGTVKIDSASGAFAKYTGFELAGLAGSAAYQLSNPTSGCVVAPIPGPQGQGGIGTGIGLDAGAVTLTGPAGTTLSSTPFTQTDNSYSINIGEEGIPGGVSVGLNGKILAGTYTLNGAGGADVGKFNATVTLGAPLNVTGGLPSVVNRSAGLPLTWTGGNASDLVEISGSSQVLVSGTLTGATFTCFTTAGQGGFTVPASILTQLPATATTGTLGIFSFGNPTNGNGIFSAPLTAGGTISNATFVGLVGTGNQPSYQ